MKIKTKIHIFSSCLLVIVLMITTFGVYTLYKNMAYSSSYHQLSKTADSLITSISQTSSVTDPESILRAYLPSKSIIQVRNDAGERIMSVQSIDGLGRLTMDDTSNQYSIIQHDAIDVLALSIPVIWTDGSIVKIEIYQQLGDVTTSLKTLRVALIAMTIAGSLLIILSSMYLARIVTKPIVQLTHTMQKNSQSSSYEKIDESNFSNDELGTMAVTFNKMIHHIEQNYEKQNHFVSNASHELRTPLTVIESYASLLHRRGIENKEITDEALKAILQESDRMRDLINQMLDLAKTSEDRQMIFETIDVQKMMQSIQQKMQLSYKREVRLHANEHWEIISDEKRLQQLVFIFLENAKNYSEGPIDIYLDATLGTIVIEDYGDGIAEEEIPHLFDRFYRTNKDRNRRTGGTGLGLAIAKNLATQLGIAINIQSELRVGTRIILQTTGGVRDEKK